MRCNWLKLAVTSIMALASSSVSLQAADYGNLKMTIILEGAAPKLKPLMIDKDVALCAAPGKKPVDETLVVGKSGGVKNVVLMLVPEKGQKIEAAPAYAAAIKKEIVLDNKNCRFEPHVVVVHTGQDLNIKNSDPVGHNSKVDFVKNTGINPSIPANGNFVVKGADIGKAESRPVLVSCSIHPWMRAQVIVADHPYVAVSDADGVIDMKDIPVGKYSFQLRHETGYVPTKGKVEFSKKGVAEITVVKGDTDLGELKMPVPKIE